MRIIDPIYLLGFFFSTIIRNLCLAEKRRRQFTDRSKDTTWFLLLSGVHNLYERQINIWFGIFIYLPIKKSSPPNYFFFVNTLTPENWGNICTKQFNVKYELYNSSMYKGIATQLIFLIKSIKAYKL